MTATTLAACGTGKDVSGDTRRPIQADPAKSEEDPTARYAELEAEYLADIRCKAEVDEILDNAAGLGSNLRFASRREWSLLGTRGRDGSVTLVSPTTLPGMWTVVRRYMNREVVVERVTARFTSTFTFGVHPTDPSLDSCAVTKDTNKSVRILDESLMERSFTDHDVLDLVKDNTHGVIYVWSPHMPYSYESAQGAQNSANGLENIQAAVAMAEAELGEPIALTIVVDPTASAALVDTVVAAEPTLDETMARPAQSIELLFRNVNHHYPAVLVYSSSLIGRNVYPGVESPAQYSEHILSQIADLDRQHDDLTAAEVTP